jgi:asparagine synthase (glutamine-hydrolysing)
MCGIFTLLNNYNELSMTFIEEQFQKGKNRGPEFSKLTSVMIKALFGFHRLAINGLNDNSNQPIIINDICIICNGEIYNYKQLYKSMNIQPKTDSDCEVIVHLYKKYGIDQTLQMLDGVFSFVLIDYRLENPESKIYIARDPYGVRPLYFLKPNYIYKGANNENNIYAFASEMKMLTEIKQKLNQGIQERTKPNILKKYTDDKSSVFNYEIYQFQPGTYMTMNLSYQACSQWEPTNIGICYHKPGFVTNMFVDKSIETHINIYKNIQKYLTQAVEKRCCTTERPIACLLSGGLDSSLITALVNDYHVANGLPKIETYSIGLEGSVDLENAKIVADYLGTKHTEIVLTEKDFLDAIPNVIGAIESYDTTTVRASIGNWLLGKYISEHSDAKVIFNGDGSDELAGGYLYMNYAPDMIDFDKETRRLLNDIYMFDVQRSDKSISSHGLEPRTPFLDRSWVQYYLSIPVEIRNHVPTNKMEKYLIRTAFSDNFYMNSCGQPLLPDMILWRKKEAFSDGVSQYSRSLYEIIQEHFDKQFLENELVEYSYIEKSPGMYEHLAMIIFAEENNQLHLLPKTAEQFYYRKIFESHYKGMSRILPYFWMPKFVNATDASARTLGIYDNDLDNEDDESYDSDE